MAKISNVNIKKHNEACALLDRGNLSMAERIFVIENWREDMNHQQGWIGAFFTPLELAQQFSMMVPSGGRILDLCAGIGTLSYISCLWENIEAAGIEIVCVERNKQYYEAGKKLMPEARWINSDVFDLPEDLGHFDCVLSNPPFGKVSKTGSSPRYTGREFEYHVMDIASDLADSGIFIVPQESAAYRQSGCSGNDFIKNGKHLKFTEQTGIEIGRNCGLDTEPFRDQWKNASPITEIVTCDFKKARETRGQVECGPVSNISESFPQGSAVQLSLLDVAA